MIKIKSKQPKTTQRVDKEENVRTILLLQDKHVP